MKEEIKNKHSSIQPKHTYPRSKMENVEDDKYKLYYY